MAGDSSLLRGKHGPLGEAVTEEPGKVRLQEETRAQRRPRGPGEVAEWAKGWGGGLFIHRKVPQMQKVSALI